MRLAQQLYEGVDVKGRGTVGLITYLRTDSTRISRQRQMRRREAISATSMEQVTCPRQPAAAKSDAKIQDAHEAIRPTDITLTPVQVKESAFQRPVPSVPADLEALRGEPDAPGGLRDNLRQNQQPESSVSHVGVQNQI